MNKERATPAALFSREDRTERGIKLRKENPLGLTPVEVQGYDYEHDLAAKKDTSDKEGNPKYFAIKGIILCEKNHRQNTQPEKTEGIDQNQNPSCNMNPQGHEFISHRIFGDYSTSIRKGCA